MDGAGFSRRTSATLSSGRLRWSAGVRRAAPAREAVPAVPVAAGQTQPSVRDNGFRL